MKFPKFEVGQKVVRMDIRDKSSKGSVFNCQVSHIKSFDHDRYRLDNEAMYVLENGSSGPQKLLYTPEEALEMIKYLLESEYAK